MTWCCFTLHNKIDKFRIVMALKNCRPNTQEVNVSDERLVFASFHPRKVQHSRDQFTIVQSIPELL